MRTFLRIKGDRIEEVRAEVVREQPLTVYIGGDALVLTEAVVS